MEMYLENKTALVTGGNRGLGRAMALELARHGAKVLIVGRNQEKTEETIEIGKKQNLNLVPYFCDVADETEINNLKAKIINEHNSPHVLINNAGTAIRKVVSDLSLSEWNKVMDINLTSAFLLSKAFIPGMKEYKWGRIINLTSIMAHIGSAERAVYCASKHALMALTKCMALELVDHGINVVAISPGYYETDLTAPLRKNEDANNELMKNTPAKRWGKPEEIGKIAAFICSPAANFMTGNDILSDGGWVAQ